MLCVQACSFLDPLPDGSYTEENYTDYPSLIRGFVDVCYSLLPSTYYTTEYIGFDASTDDFIFNGTTSEMYKFSTGNAQPGSYSTMTNAWGRDYYCIYNVNRFLKDDLGKNTRYLIDDTNNASLQKCLQGDAYALRAWFMYDLVKAFGGMTASGELLGVPIFTEPIDIETADIEGVRRATFDECMEQIVRDCDSALVYLPLANRDFLVDVSGNTVLGARRYRAFDQIAVKALLARAYLMWASPAYNPDGDMTRWKNAALYAKEVIDHKINVEGIDVTYSSGKTEDAGFDRTAKVSWSDPNDPEIIWLSNFATSTSFETHFYPQGFNGDAATAPSQDFVDAFPDAKGYPITHPSSVYDPKHPYLNRDPRFYANIFYNGSEVWRGNDTTSDLMYTFNTSEGGADAPGLVSTSLTGYYARKYVYSYWNAYDRTVYKAVHWISYLRWTHMCLAFAEAANHFCGPEDSSTFGVSARDVLSWVRARQTTLGDPGVGSEEDPYLDECAASGRTAFDSLVKNEWRIETFIEGFRFWDLRRWCDDSSWESALNVDVHGVKITATETDTTYTRTVVQTKKFNSHWMPLPYSEVRKSSGLVQNEGWENWK